MTNQTLKIASRKAYILVGPPCSGKSTWRENYKFWMSASVLNRDTIREEFFGRNVKYSSFQERTVTEIEEANLAKALVMHQNIIIDNTNCQVKTLNKWLKSFNNTDFLVEVVFFDTPFWKQRLRNIRRYLFEGGVWIPRSVAKRMNEGYQKVLQYWFGGSSLEYYKLLFHKGVRKNPFTYEVE